MSALPRRRLLLAPLLSAFLPRTAWPAGRPPARTKPWPSLQQALRRAATGTDGVLGVTALHLPTGRRASHNGDRRFAMASVYKLPIAVVLLDAVERGRFKLDESWPVTAADLAPGRDALDGQTIPAQGSRPFRLDRLLDVMMRHSDNTSTDLILARLGGPPAVMKYLRAHGLTGIRVDRPTRQLRSSPPAPGAPPSDGDLRDTCTPEGMASLLAALAQGRLLSPATWSHLLGTISGKDVNGPNRLAGLLPPGTFIAHKTGTNPQRVFNDVGLVRLPGEGGELAVAAFLADSRRPEGQREALLAQVGRIAYDEALQPPARAQTE